jgi:molybdate transport system substrate-binding protein
LTVVRRFCALLCILAATVGVGPLSAAEPVRVFAAASLKNAIDAAGAAFSKAHPGTTILTNYGASSALAKQIEQGAPADVYLSADLDWMDHLSKAELIVGGTRKSLLGNTLVLVAAAGSGLKADLTPGADLAGLLAGGKLAVADVKAVPAGKYAKAALESLGLWAKVEASLAQTENVRAALALVARKEARLGIVYGTDAKSEPGVEVLATFPETSHAPIVYPVAVTTAAKDKGDAKAFVDFLGSAGAKAIFEAQGFKVLP